jgi:PPOX class probable F420-dependent enzyme
VPTAEPTVLTERVRAFLQLPHFASLATVGPDGGPNQAVIWYRLEPDDRILLNSREGRRWPANLRREPRANLAVFSSADPNEWVGLTCRVDAIDEAVERARDDIAALAQRYDDATEETLATFRTQQRVTFRLRILRVHDHLEGD